jgi:Fic family protein
MPLLFTIFYQNIYICNGILYSMRVIKRKNFYYLQHSFRKGGKVFTKESYLGKTMPKSIEKSKKELFQKCRKESFYDNFEKIKNKFKEELKSLPESAKQKMLEELSVNFTYNTNAIEGSSISEEDTRDIVLNDLAPTKSLRDIKETEKHAQLFQKILQENIDVSKKTILEWHKELFFETKKDIAGKFREHLIRVGNYVAPDWQDVSLLLDELFKFINSKNKSSKNTSKDADADMNTLEFIARVHYRFEKIHPFSDGNGRIGRLLMNYLLWREEYPMLIIEYKKRKSYYRAFQKDEEYFVQYFIKRYLAVHKRYLK